MENSEEEPLLLSGFIYSYIVSGNNYNPVFHHSNIPELCVGVVFVKIVAGFFVIL
jgi:hypothetical protein